MMKWDENSLFLAINAAEVALWTWNVDTDKISLDNAMRSLGRVRK